MKVTFLIACCMAAPLSLQAHHTYAEYDNQKTVEIEGRLVTAAWINPHARLQVQVVEEQGKVVQYEVESAPANSLRRGKVPVEIYGAGSIVKVAGWPSRRSPTRLYGTNIRSSDGQESVLWQSKPRWATTAYGFGQSAPDLPAPGRPGPETLFHVWASLTGDPDAGPGALARAALSLTSAAQQMVAAFNPVEQTTSPGCTPKGMPTIMNNPTPMEFVDQKDVILLRMEEYDTVRTIHMTARANPESQPKTAVGYSTGRWDGKTLVVDTSRISARYFNNRGITLGKATHLVERFTPSADGNRLHYTLTATDPEILTTPAEMKRSWVYKPNEKVMPFNCTTDVK